MDHTLEDWTSTHYQGSWEGVDHNNVHTWESMKGPTWFMGISSLLWILSVWIIVH